MGQTTDQIADEIDRTRDDLKSNLEELEMRVKSMADWRDQFRKHTGPMVAAALVGGVLVSSMFGSLFGKR
jgi:F0F1-type ATP synthase assembly protein I